MPTLARRKWAVMDIATWIHSSGQPGLWGGGGGGVAWVRYDAAFRRQAFITGNRQWSKVNPSLYSICFSGAARTGVRCKLCLSLCHPTCECTLVCDPNPDVSTRLKTLESAVLAFTSHAPLQQGLPLRAKSSDVCRNWNAGKCHMPQCRFRHACIVCGGPNPAFACFNRVSVQIPIGYPSVNLH